MRIFQNLDLLIGFVSLMLAAGTVVATGTQLVASLSRMRPLFLRRALEDLLGQIDPRHLTPSDARELASLLLRHPWLCGRSNGCASDLRREDFVRLLIELAAGASPLAARLRRSFAFRSAREASHFLQSIGSEALRLEMELPGESARDRNIKAVIAVLGPHPLLARIHHWYGLAMARATQRYRLQARLVTAVLAMLLVLVARIDLLQFFFLPASSPWPGLTLSWLLISLGTPFWYDRLKDLLHFRPSAN